MTLDEYCKWVKEFDPEKHMIVYPDKVISKYQSMHDWCFNECQVHSITIRPRTPEKKMRPMNWSELRELVVQGMWFYDSRDKYWIRPITLDENLNRINHGSLVQFLRSYSHYSPTASMQDAKPLEVEDV